MERFEQAVAIFDKINAGDPHKVLCDGVETPETLCHARRLSSWIAKLAPNASEALKLAGHCQHLKRWETPRDSYPEGKKGYLQWRAAQAIFHAKESSAVLEQVGYDEAVINRVMDINKKKGLRNDPEVQIMEDALCLVFLEFEALEFAAKHPREKVVDIIRKTWGKMSVRGHAEARSLQMNSALQSIIEDALQES